MLVRFTPKQIEKVRDCLKQGTFRGYEINLFMEIMKALDEAIDEKPVQKVKQTDSDIVNRYASKYEKPNKPDPDVLNKMRPVTDDVAVTEKIDEVISNINSDIEPTEAELEQAPIFGVIDRRKRSSDDYV